MKDHATATTELADDVMKGHLATNVTLLNKVTFMFLQGRVRKLEGLLLGLLDEAWAEYGFRQKGTLVVPCRPIELHNILDPQKT
ncbi:SAUR-like auxin-responsive family protein [Trifolium pratense]|uniref:SAUR-like auxin-responsive family protein n=1 Tax=Trifolium pratense TaxID=57577 RepID=A0A2K3P648_TRIPR|nr:SAUR-like auxin-responsive family protein [Trifolium pratense]